MKCPNCGFLNIAGADECESCLSSLSDLDHLVPKKGMERKIMEGSVADLSPKPALSVAPGDSIKTAIETMRKAKAGSVLVLESGRLVGVFSERELLFGVPASADPAGIAVKELMRRNPTFLSEGDAVADVFHRMAVSGYRHIPVRMKDGSYGVVSARDLLRYLCK